MTAAIGDRVRQYLNEGKFDLPLPGSGKTADRLSALGDLGADDLVLARLAEAHTDALAIIAEVAPRAGAGEDRRLWGVWAADPPGSPLRASTGETADAWTLSGSKPWCSGAHLCDRALVTAHSPDGYRLFAVDTSQSGVHIHPSQWVGNGMSGSDTCAVDFDAAAAITIGGPGDYLEREGFWWGAAGVAAVWLGGARRVAAALHRAAAKHEADLVLASLGRVDAAQHAAWCTLLEVARLADGAAGSGAGGSGAGGSGPGGFGANTSPQLAAVRCRAAVETAVEVTLRETARATGPGPLAMDAEHARHVADLQVYIRQSHGDRDLATLGALVCASAALEDSVASSRSVGSGVSR